MEGLDPEERWSDGVGGRKTDPMTLERGGTKERDNKDNDRPKRRISEQIVRRRTI